MSTVSRTFFTFEVLHRTDEPFTWDHSPGDGPLDNNLGEALARSWDGHAVGSITQETTESVDDGDVEFRLIQLGNDGTFFDDDLVPLYEHTHVSVSDGSPAMLISQDDSTITLVNEDGLEWTDPIGDWRPI